MVVNLPGKGRRVTTDPPQLAVAVEALTRRFAVRQSGRGRDRRTGTELTAVDAITLRIPRGELFGLLGPNGAGKTTTIRMLCTLLPPTGGTAHVWDFDVVREPAQVRRHIGVLLTGERSVYWRLTGRENLEYFAALHDMPRDIVPPRITGLLDLVELTPRADDLVERYSTGMRQRLALVKTLLHDPPVLLLDEPTAGLDPQTARIIRELIRHLHQEDGKTIVLTTHDMDEADQLCERVGIIDRGRIVALDSPQALKRAHRGNTVLRLEVEGQADRAATALRALPGVAQLTVRPQPTDSSWEITVALADGPSILPQAVQAVSGQGLQIRHLELLEMSLEDVFIALTGRRLRD
jgi:ABC-2 type transport system ATP-binding protein